MRRNRLQILLFMCMTVLSFYIIHKSLSILRSSGELYTMAVGSKVRQNLEDAGMRTWAPGFAWVVEGAEPGNWFREMLNPSAPVFHYLAKRASQENELSEADISEMDMSEKDVPEMDLTEMDVTEKDVTEMKMPEVDMLDTEEGIEEAGETKESVAAVSGTVIPDYSSLLAQYYTVDGGTCADEQLLDGEALLGMDMRIQQDSSKPQILIYHTHSQEAFLDSEEGKWEDTIVGMGEILAEELENYGYQVIHDRGIYDLREGVLDRSAAYDYAREAVSEILKDNPEIEVIIDLHRDGVEGKKFVTEIDGEPTSMIMFFNGISRNKEDQPITYLENPYIKENLAFSLQLQMEAEKSFPGFTRNIYLKAERFNLHMRPRSLLIEAGTQLNTVEEERNAMPPLAKMLFNVLDGQ